MCAYKYKHGHTVLKKDEDQIDLEEILPSPVLQVLRSRCSLPVLAKYKSFNKDFLMFIVSYLTEFEVSWSHFLSPSFPHISCSFLFSFNITLYGNVFCLGIVNCFIPGKLFLLSLLAFQLLCVEGKPCSGSHEYPMQVVFGLSITKVL